MHFTPTTSFPLYNKSATYAPRDKRTNALRSPSCTVGITTEYVTRTECHENTGKLKQKVPTSRAYNEPTTMRYVSAAGEVSVGLQLTKNWCISHHLVPVATPLWKCETHTLFLNFTSVQGSSSSTDTDRQTDNRHAMRRSHVHSVSFSCARAKPSRTTYFLQPNVPLLSAGISAAGKEIQRATLSKQR